jgi:hypothetical protein
VRKRGAVRVVNGAMALNHDSGIGFGGHHTRSKNPC